MYIEFENILNSDLTVKEKMDKINETLSNIKEDAKEALKKLEDGYEFCNECQEYYKKKAWAEEIKTEVRHICTYWPLAEFDDPEYGDVPCRIQYKTCPRGHIFTKNLDSRW